VLEAVLDSLAEFGYERLSLEEITSRAGPAGAALGADPDLEGLVVAALEYVEILPPPVASGDLRLDLQAFLKPWRASPRRDERALAAVLSATTTSPRLRDAVHHALDRPLAFGIGHIVARAADERQVPPPLVQTLCWVVRALFIDRLRSGPRSYVDLDRLADYLLAGLRIAEMAAADEDALP
jgi:hypothetical protein